MVSIARPSPADRAEWESLFRAYIDFYDRTESQQMYDRAWTEFQAGDRMHALGASTGGPLVGIAHFLIHASTSSRDVCYLQDLFTAPEARGRGRTNPGRCPQTIGFGAPMRRSGTTGTGPRPTILTVPFGATEAAARRLGASAARPAPLPVGTPSPSKGLTAALWTSPPCRPGTVRKAANR